MILTIIWAILAASISYAAGAVSASQTSRMLDEVNQKLPPEERFGLLGWYPAKYQRLTRLHRELYPASPRRRLVWLSAVIAMTAYLLGVVPLLWSW